MAGVITALALVIVAGVGPARAGAASMAPHVLTAQTPDVVVHGQAMLRGAHDPNALLTLTISLGVRDSARLDALIGAANDPSSPSYGHNLTNAQYLAQFAPTAQQVQAVRDWAAGTGLTVEGVSPDNLLVSVQGTARRVEQALGVALDDYSLNGRVIMSNNHDAAVPAGLDISAISGLSTVHQFYALPLRPFAQANGGQGFYPRDFQAAYNTAAVGDGSGQIIGFTLWGAPVPQSDLNTFAANTGSAPIVAGQAGANGIDWIPVNGGSSDTNELIETAMDVEYAHGVAPNSHLKYWLSDCTYDPSTGQCNPSDTGLEQAVSAAANDSSVHVVSNSWGGGEATSAADPFVSTINAALQHAASVGTTFYFSSGDNGYLSGGTSNGCVPAYSFTKCQGRGLPSFPSDSPYVVSVGGTALSTNADSSYLGESVWGSTGDGAGGGGCSTVLARPAWQTGTGAATCAGRAVPDVAADADPATGAYVYVQGSGQTVGGTSLAAPLWAGMAADVNNYLGAHSQPSMGFAAPRLYQLATNAATYSRDFHDVTYGNNDPTFTNHGYYAGIGWDEATGWGSPNLANLAADWTAGAPPATSTPTPTAGPGSTATAQAGSMPTATATVTPSSTSTVTVGPSSTPTTNPTATSTASPSATPTNTAAPSPTATSTPPPTATSAATASPTPTQTPTSTVTASATPMPTATSTRTPTAAPTVAPPTATATSTPSPSAPTVAATATAVDTAVPPTATPRRGHPVPPMVSIGVSQLRHGHGRAESPVITVGVRTAPRAPVVIVATLSRDDGRAASHHAHAARSVVLSQTTVHTRADGAGRVAGALAVAYDPARPMQAMLTIMVRTPSGTTTRSLRFNLAPWPRSASRRGGHSR